MHRRLDLRDIPGRHTEAWDAMFAQDIDRARHLLSDLITDDATITFKFPEGDFGSPPGIDGWIAVVTTSAQNGGWVPVGPGLPQSMHLAGSVLVLHETSRNARLRVYVRASHYSPDTTADFSEAILEFEMVYARRSGGWRIAHLDLIPLSLRDEGGMVLPPVTGG